MSCYILVLIRAALAISLFLNAIKNFSVYNNLNTDWGKELREGRFVYKIMQIISMYFPLYNTLFPFLTNGKFGYYTFVESL